MVSSENEFESEAMRVGSFENLLRFDGVHRRGFFGAFVHDPVPLKIFNSFRNWKENDDTNEWMNLQIRIIVLEAWYVMDFHLSSLSYYQTPAPHPLYAKLYGIKLLFVLHLFLSIINEYVLRDYITHDPIHELDLLYIFLLIKSVKCF